MVRHETVKLLILYWTTYIEYDVQTIYPRHKMGLNMLLDIVILDYNALCPIMAKSCTCWQLSHADYLLSLSFLMVAAAQNTNNTTIRFEGKLAHLEQPLIPPHYPRALENYKAYDMMQELKTMFEEQAKHELFEKVQAFHACKQEDGQSVSSYLLKMKSYLERLGYAIPNELGVSLILNSLNKDYDQFVQNYNMHSMGKTIAELHVMLKLHEKGIPKKVETPIVLAIQEGKIQIDKKKPQGAKGKDKGKTKLAYAPKPMIPPPPKRDNLAKDSICHHCNEVGYRRRNCPSYHAELKKRKNGLSESRKLKHETLSLYMGN
ncbi:hypothetical protein Tco_0089399 [Tanacetum coccineum]